MVFHVSSRLCYTRRNRKPTLAWRACGWASACIVLCAVIVALVTCCVKARSAARPVTAMDDPEQTEQSTPPPAGTTIGRDQINIHDSPGAIVGSVSGGVNQNFGTQTTINIVVNQILRPTPPRYRAAVRRMVEDYEAIFGG